LICLNLKQIPKCKEKKQKITLEETQQLIEYFKISRPGPITFEIFQEVCQLLCLQIVLLTGKASAGKKRFHQRLLTEAFSAADEMVRKTYIFHPLDGGAHPLQVIAAVILIIPLFSFKKTLAPKPLLFSTKSNNFQT